MRSGISPQRLHWAAAWSWPRGTFGAEPRLAERVFHLWRAGLIVLPAYEFTGRAAHPSAQPRSLRGAVLAALADRRLRWLWLTGTLAMARQVSRVGAFLFRAPARARYHIRGALFGAAALIGGIVGGFVGVRWRPAPQGAHRGRFDVASAAAFSGRCSSYSRWRRGAASFGVGACSRQWRSTPYSRACSGDVRLRTRPSPRRDRRNHTLCLGGIGAARGRSS